MDAPPLGPGEVHVWRARPDAPPWAEALLSPDERARAARLRREEDRRRLVAGRALARLLLGAYAGVEPATLAFDATCRHCGAAHGKPRAVGLAHLDFSVSHSGDWVLVAVGRDVEVGVDVERRRDDALTPGAAETVLAPREVALVGEAVTPEAARDAFFRLWTRKEAVLKMLGHGLAGKVAPTSIDLAASGDAPWWVRDVDVGADHAAAVAAARAPAAWSLHEHAWRP